MHSSGNSSRAVVPTHSSRSSRRCITRLLQVTGLLTVLTLAVTACGGGGGGGSATFSLNGYVLSGSTGVVISGAQVTAGDRVAVTGSDGRYSLTGIPVGNGNITVRAVATGYNAGTTSLQVSAGENRRQDFQLYPANQGGSTTVTGNIIYVGSATWATAAAQTAAGPMARAQSASARPSFTAPAVPRVRHVTVRLPAGSSVSGLTNGFRAQAMDQAIRELLAVVGLDVDYRVHPRLEAIGQRVVTIEVPEGMPAEIFAARLLATGKVMSAEPAQYAYPMAYPTRVPNDPYYTQQYQYELLGMPQTWGVQTDARSVRVAVVDTGVALNHPDLQSNLLPGWDTVDNDNNPTDPGDSTGFSHGTTVAGLVGANTNNNYQVAGTTWTTGIIPIRVLYPDPTTGEMVGTAEDIADGILLATDPYQPYRADVINLSLGAQGEIPPRVRAAIDTALQRGALVVAAAGNHDQGQSTDVYWPANYGPVIAVAAIDANKAPASFSNWGQAVDVAAPGHEVLSTGYSRLPGGGSNYSPVTESGTSLASPIVAGIVALMRAAGIPASQIETILRRTAEDVNTYGFDQKTGYGMVNPYLAVTNTDPASTWIGVVDSAGNPLSHAVHPAYTSTGWTYSITSVRSGWGWVFAWLDVNRDGYLNDGDYIAKHPNSQQPLQFVAGQSYSFPLPAGIFSSTPVAQVSTQSLNQIQTLWNGLKKAIAGGAASSVASP